MGLILSVLSFFAARHLAARSIGHAIGFALVVGCGFGILRAQIYDVGSYLIFDAAILSIYLVAYKYLRGRTRPRQQALIKWVVALCGLPFVLILLSPFLDGQPLLVQLLGLRPAMFFVPIVLVGAFLTEEEWLDISRWAACAALVCAAVAVAELVLGVERFFPVNQATRLIYSARDVGDDFGLRIPSTFPSSHAYSGTMIGMFPILLRRLDRRGFSKAVTWSSLLAAGFGALISGARLSMLIFGLMLVVLLLRSARRSGLFAGLIVLGVVLGVLAPRTDQFRRIETLRDSEAVADRVASSVNVSLLEAMADAPLGYGLGMAFGTSIPYFLAELAKPQIGMESEYARLAVEEGVLGVVLWVGFIFWTLLNWPFGGAGRRDVVGLAMWTFCVAFWVAGLIGAGLLTSIPLTLLLLSQMGAVAVARPSTHSAADPRLATREERGVQLVPAPIVSSWPGL